jgi:hypothetical protein
LTPQQQADKLNLFIGNFDNLIADTFESATLNLLTDIKTRVFGEHEDTSGGKLGQYSTKPTLIGAKSFINKGGANTFFEAQKKKEDGKWRTVKGKHLFVLDGGYKELRQIQGRQTAEIDLQYSFELAKSGLTTKIGSGVYQVKFANLLSQNKGRGFEKRRGKKVFYASNEEQKKATSFVGKKIVGELKKAFGNV